jgi:N-sulfoglucosamine sulfohydrolase
MQGLPFLGDNLPSEREYVYGIRDRMDETVDMMRSVRDKRYKYIRNYMPERPYAQNIGYMNQMPTMQEWRRLNAEGKLEGAQKLFFAPTKPVEELYDIATDPHEIKNLATDAKFADILQRLRTAHEKWTLDTHDIGMRPEIEVMEEVRPGGKWSVTSEPQIKIGDKRATITCATEGASIAYRLDSMPKNVWELYTQPVDVSLDAKISAQAFRLGYKESEVVSQ